MGRREGASGTVELPVGDPGTLAPTRWYPVCGVGGIGDTSSPPRSVRVRVGRSSAAQSLYQAALPAGVWWTPPGVGYVAWVGLAYCGVIRWEYGAQGMQRVLYSDLRSGEYQIPPCEFLRVSAARYTPYSPGEGGAPADPTSYVIEGEIADGVASDFSPLLLTAPSKFTAANSYTRVASPPGAYAYEICPSAAAGRFFTLAPAAVRDFDDGIWLPPASPLPLLGSDVQIATSDTLRSCDLVYWVR